MASLSPTSRTARMTPTPRGKWAGKLQTQGGGAKFSRTWRDEATDAGAWGVSPQRTPHPPAPAPSYFWMICGRLAGGGGGGCIPRGPGGAAGTEALGTLRASLSGCSGQLESASWLMAAASTMWGESCPDSRRESAREGQPQGTGAHWPGSLCPVPLSFPVARGGDARGGEEAVPAAPPPPPCAAPAPPTRPRGGGGQGASPGGQEPLGAGVVRGTLPAGPERCERGHRAASATRHRAPSGSRAAGYAAQHNRVRRSVARQPAARRPPPSSRFSPEAAAPGCPGHGARGPARSCQAGHTERARTSARIAGAKCAGLLTFPRLEACQRHSLPRARTPRVKSPDPPRGRWDLQPQVLDDQARGLSQLAVPAADSRGT